MNPCLPVPRAAAGPRPARALAALALALALSLAAAPAALGDPSPGAVEVRDDLGAAVGTPLTGPDALRLAVARVRTGRADDARPWSLVAGAGTYGDVLVDEPNLTVRPLPGAAVTIAGTGGTSDTGGGCVDVRRGGVVLDGLGCRTPSRRGVEVRLGVDEGGVVLRNLSVDRPGSDGIAVSGGAGVVIEGGTVAGARGDGVRLATLTGPGPYAVSGLTVRGSGDDGIDLVDDVQRLQVGGVTLDGSRDNGLESDDAGSSDLLLAGSVIARSGDQGVAFGGGGLRLAVSDTQITESGEHAVDLGRGSGIRLSGVRLDGSDRDGGIRFSTDFRAGGVYERLDLGGSAVDLPGEPRGVVVSAVTPERRAALPAAPEGFTGLARFVAVKDAGRASGSTVTLRFPLGDQDRAGVRVSRLAVFEDDPPANGGAWERMTAALVDAAGNARLALGDRDIASGSDARTAVYALFAPPAGAPEVEGVFPRDGSTARGRDVLVAARVRDDEPLSTGSFALTIDGRRRGGVSYREGVVRFRVAGLTPGRRTARLTVVDPKGLRDVRRWTFTVANARPALGRPARVRPRPGSRLRAGVATVLVPVRDDAPARLLKVALRVDGRRVAARVRAGRVVGRVSLSPGRRRLSLVVSDRDGARAGRSWTVRVVTAG